MKLIRIGAIIAFLFFVAGCAGMSPTEQRVLSGGAIGAGAGAALGAATGGSPGLGAAIGGAAGAFGGAIVDQYERNRDYGYPPYAPPPREYGPPGYGPPPY